MNKYERFRNKIPNDEREQMELTIVGLDGIETAIIQKSERMFELTKAMCVNPKKPKDQSLWFKMPFGSMKINDIYLARINSHEPDKRFVFIPIEEVYAALGVKRIKKESLLSWLACLQSPVYANNWSDELVNLYEYSKPIYDEYDHLIGIKLACSSIAAKYIFNLDINHISYIKLRAASVLKLKSQYAYELLGILISRFTHTVNYLHISPQSPVTFELKADYLKKELDCPKSYDFHAFKQNILDPSFEEINEKTGFKCSFKSTSYYDVYSIKVEICYIGSPSLYMIAEDDSKYPDADSFESYEALEQYRLSLSEEERRNYDAITEVRDSNHKKGRWFDMLIRCRQENEISKQWQNYQLSVLAGLCVEYLKKYEVPEEYQDSSYVSDSPTFYDFINLIQRFEDLTEEKVLTHKVERSSFCSYVISCIKNEIQG